VLGPLLVLAWELWLVLARELWLGLAWELGLLLALVSVVVVLVVEFLAWVEVASG